MRAFSVSIQRDEKGRHVVRYPKLNEELAVPETYPDQLAWIRQSCERFLKQVRDKQELVGASASPKAPAKSSQASSDSGKY